VTYNPLLTSLPEFTPLHHHTQGPAWTPGSRYSQILTPAALATTVAESTRGAFHVPGWRRFEKGQCA